MATVRTGIYSVYIYFIIDVLTCSTANPFSTVFSQGQVATLNCSETITEELEIFAIDYHTQSCQHTDTISIANLCNGNRSCSFDVTNANIGSSCGVKEIASLNVTFKCIRDGGWSDLLITGCLGTCGASTVNYTRRCDNPSPNEYGVACDGDTVGEVTCMENYCYYDGVQTKCEDQPANLSCSEGYIYTDLGRWETKSQSCLLPSGSDSADVTDKLSQLCNNRTYCTFNLSDSALQATCEKCSEFKYGYNCKVAYWSEWSLWTDCSVSCGIGTRSRSRECSGLLITADNHSIGCEGNDSDWSVCNAETCPYCPTNITSAKPNTYFNDTSAGTGYVQIGDIHTISCCARIDSWTFMPVHPGILTIFILRMMTKHNYKIVGTNSIHVSVSDINQFKTYTIPDNESIGIINGSIVGWFDDNSNIIGYTECQDINESCPEVFRLNIESVDIDTELDIQGLKVQPNRSYELYYTTSNNRQPEIKTNNDIIAIPDHSRIDSYITIISIEDPDIGDYVINFELDYFNDFVYFDTKLRSLHVKAKLPHIVGQHNTSLLYRLTVVDSCDNKANRTITFISYNDPPLLTSVPSKVTIQASTAGIDIPFSQFSITDPSGDNITCTIFNNGSDTDHFSLKQEGHNGATDLSLFLMENYNAVINTSTILELSCTDGTSTANKLLTIDFQNENHVEIVTSKPAKISSVIPIVVPVACVLIIIAAVLVVIIFKRKNKKNDVQKIVEYTKTDENMGISREQNHYAGLGEQDEMEDKEPQPIENAYNPAWR